MNNSISHLEKSSRLDHPGKRVAEIQPKKNGKKALPHSSRDLHLEMYFHDISKIQGFCEDEDIEAAKNIVDLEMDLWRAIFSDPIKTRTAAEIVLKFIDEQGQHLADPQNARTLVMGILQRLDKAHRRSAKGAGAPNPTDRLAVELHRADIDRKLAEFTAKELMRTKLNSGSRVDRVASKAYRIGIKNAFTRVKTAKRRFVEAHLALVVSIARSFYRGHMPLLDLIQEGNLGLIKAVDRYDHSKGFRFVTYATWWIRAGISRAITDKGQAVRVPANTYHTRTRVDRAVQSIRGKQGREPTREELQNETGLSLHSLTRIRETGSVAIYSLDQKIPGTEDHYFVDLLEDENIENPFESTLTSIWTDRVPRLLDMLTPLERAIILSRFGFTNGQEMTLKEVGEKVKLSRERIRQLQNQALKKLKKQLSSTAA